MEAIGGVASVLGILQVLSQIQTFVSDGQNSIQKRNEMEEHVKWMKERFEEIERNQCTLAQEVLRRTFSTLNGVKDTLESIQQPSTCSRCPSVVTCIWHGVRRSAIRGKLDHSKYLLDKLTREVLVDAFATLVQIDQRVPRMGKNEPATPSCEIGLDRVQKILDFLEQGGDRLRVVGIHGPGGLGKTTLLNATLKELLSKGTFSTTAYAQLGDNLDVESLKKLQSDILQELGGSRQDFQSVQHGKTALRDHLLSLSRSNKTLCLFMDNVWNPEDLQRLFPDELPSILPSCSCIMVTSRVRSVVQELEMLCSSGNGGRPLTLSYEPEFLSPEASTKLFVDFASKRNPLTDSALVEAIVPLCGGLPLAIEVLGCLFRDEAKRERSVWEEVKRGMETLEEAFPEESGRVSKALQLSYERLKDRSQEAFLDVAAFFYGWDWHTVKRIVGEDEMKELEDSCLLKQADGKKVKPSAVLLGSPCNGVQDYRWSEVNERRNLVTMHDLILKLGRSRAGERDHLRVGSQLHGSSDIMLQDNAVLRKVRGLCQTVRDDQERIMFDWKQLERMERLRVLHVEDGSIFDEEGCVIRQPEQLRYLSLDLMGQPTLEMRERSSGLRFILLRNFSSNFSHVKLPAELRELHLHGCPGVVELSLSSSQLRKLECLHIHDCYSFSKLPESCGNWMRLKELVIIRSVQITELPAGIVHLELLEVLILRGCSRMIKLPTLSNFKRLTSLNLRQCSSLETLPALPGSLTLVDLRGCESLVSMSAEDSRLPLLKMLLLDESGIQVESVLDIRELTQLESLSMRKSRNLKVLPPAVGELCALRVLDLSECRSLTELPEELGKLLRLEELHLGRCESLTKLPDELAKLSALEVLDAPWCQALECLPPEMGKLQRLRNVHLTVCTKLQHIPETICHAVALEQLWLSDCEQLSELPEEIGSLTSLRILALARCRKLQSLPASIGNAVSLEYLDVGGCEELSELPEEIGNLRSLKNLELRGCVRLTKLPSVGSAVKVDFSACKSLEWTELPPHLYSHYSFGEWRPPLSELLGVSELEYLEVRMNDGVTESMWADIGKLGSLRELKLVDEDGSSRDLPLQVLRLSQLRRLKVEGFGRLEVWPDVEWVLPGLESLCVERLSNLKRLPSQVCCLSQLRELKLVGCNSLEDLPANLARLKLEELYMDDCGGRLCCSFQLLPISLKVLHLIRMDVRELAPSIKRLQALKDLVWDRAGSLANSMRVRTDVAQAFGNRRGEEKTMSGRDMIYGRLFPPSLKDVSALRGSGVNDDYMSLVSPSEIGDLASLERLYLEGCDPRIGELTNLGYLGLVDCKNVGRLGQLPKLRTLAIRNCDIDETLALPQSGVLELVRVVDCRRLRCLLGDNLRLLHNLADLHLQHCESLVSLPEEICMLASLRFLLLEWCPRLEKLPSQMGNLVNLHYFALTGCMSLASLPPSLAHMPNLKYLDLKWCPGLRHAQNQVPKSCRVSKDPKWMTWRTRADAIVVCIRLMRSVGSRWSSLE